MAGEPAPGSRLLTAARGPVVLLFVDGLGWGDPDPATNPCHAGESPFFALPDRRHLGAAEAALPCGGVARPLDAVLGVPGLPQSATGQTTLLTGVNAQARLGFHLTGFPNATLRAILTESSLLKRLASQGVSAAFQNAYRPRFFQLPRDKQLRLSATTVANLAAGLPFFTLEDVRRERAVYQEFTNAELRERGFDVPQWEPEHAGRVLGRLARSRQFTLFEYFQTDRAGHAQDTALAVTQLARLDRFVRGLLDALDLSESPRPGDSLVVLTSDHGNIEDLTTRSHTTNPVPLMAWGAGAAALAAGLTRLDQVAPALAARLAPAPPAT